MGLFTSRNKSMDYGYQMAVTREATMLGHKANRKRRSTAKIVGGERLGGIMVRVDEIAIYVLIHQYPPIS